MILKIVILFLVFMGVMSMFGKLRLPFSRRRALKCPDCGRHKIGRTCDCNKRS